MCLQVSSIHCSPDRGACFPFDDGDVVAKLFSTRLVLIIDLGVEAGRTTKVYEINMLGFCVCEAETKTHTLAKLSTEFNSLM